MNSFSTLHLFKVTLKIKVNVNVPLGQIYTEKISQKHDTEVVPNERQERTRVREELILKRWRHKMSTHPEFSARATGNHAHQRTWSPQIIIINNY